MEKDKNTVKYAGVFSVFLTAVIIRIILAMKCQGFSTDINCFYCWAERAYEVGITNFYSPDVFSDYPPGYIYILYFVGMIISVFNLSYLTPATLLTLKLPAVFCDMFTGFAVYRYVSKRDRGYMQVIIPALYILNPVIIQNSSVWGQVDSVFNLAIVLMVMFMNENKMIPSYFAFAVGILIKPQTAIFTPLLILGIYDNVFRKGFEIKKFFKNLFFGLSAIGFIFVAFLPFGISKIINLYIETMSSYPYASVNAYNFWTMLGLNWEPQDAVLFGPVTCKMAGSLVIPLICVFSAIIFIMKINQKDRYWMTGAFIIMTMFLFSVRMHERYIYPVFIMLLMAYFENRKKVNLWVYCLFSAMSYLNLWNLLEFSGTDTDYFRSNSVKLISFVMTFTGILFYTGLIVNSKIEKLKDCSVKTDIKN